MFSPIKYYQVDFTSDSSVSQVLKALKDMIKRKTSSGLLSIAVMLLAAAATLSGPAPQQPERFAGPPPIEVLIPQGERADNGVMIRVLAGGEVVEMTMERYLIGVVAAEMLASFETEALKAQAAAARTNAMHIMKVAPKSRHPEAHVCTEVSCCTAFKGDSRLRDEWGAGYEKNINRIISAVIDTDGVYMSYDDVPVLAVFHSSSAGKTEASGSVWIDDLPYLVSVDSPETAEDVPGYISTVRVPRGDFYAKIRNAYPDAAFTDGGEPLILTSNITYTDSGRVYEYPIGGVRIKGTSLRSLFNLRSTAFKLELISDEFVFTTTGFGHGVGMSQYGANVMAAAGKDYTEILRHYYTGVTINSFHPAVREQYP